jgi:uncharacterized repeat protein (TIGR02543 family)
VPVTLVIKADGTGTNAEESANWQVKGQELKMDYSGHESIVKWSVSGSQLTLSNPDDMATLGAGGLMLVTYSPFTKQSGSTGGGDETTIPTNPAEKLSLQYNGNGYNGELPEISQHDSGSAAQVSSFIPAWDGYTFKGWNTDPGGKGTAYAAGAAISITKNTTLYAQWQADTTTGGNEGGNNTYGPIEDVECPEIDVYGGNSSASQAMKLQVNKLSAQSKAIEDASDFLLGVLPLEGMDLMVDTVNQKLIEPVRYFV